MTFLVNVFQLELLNDKPDILSINKNTTFPKNILNFRNDYKSITAFGIFYYDNIVGDIDFLYTIPENIHLKNKNLPINISTRNRSASFTCNKRIGSPNCGCKSGINNKEIEETCSIDVFVKSLIDYKIGAPINDKKILRWVLNYLEQLQWNADNLEIVKEVLKCYEGEHEKIDELIGKGGPSVFLTIIDENIE